jgi:WD40 repeat protein
MDGCCTVKYPPRGAHGVAAPQQQADGGVRAIFGRNTSLVYPPTDWKPSRIDTQLPDCTLLREYVYGYNGSVKRSVHFISEQECIYPVAALVVIQSLADTSQQHFFEGHDRSVTCLDYNERRRICASGQTDPKGAGGPYICIWSPEFPDRTISQLHHHSRQVTALALSSDGQTVVSFGGDDAHTLCIWRDFARWDGNSGPARDRIGGIVAMEKKAPIFTHASGRVATRCVYMGLWTTDRGEHQQRNISFYTIGYGDPDGGGQTKSGHFRHWTVSLGKRPGEEPTVSDKRGVFGKGSNVPRLMTGIASTEEPGGAYMVGDNGYFYVLTAGVVTQSRRILPQKSSAGLGCVATLPGGRWIAGSITGDIYIGRCDPVPRVEETFRAAELIGPEAELFCTTSQIKLSELKVQQGRLLLGTSNHALFSADLGQRGIGQVLQVSHGEEAWALDFHPSLAILATASNGKDVRFWNVAERRPAVGKVLRVDNAIHALAFNPEGSLLALGCAAGVLEVHGFPSLQPVFKQTLSQDRESFVDVRFSDDGRMLAAANWDQAIFLLKVATTTTRDNDNGSSPNIAVAPARVMMHKVLTGNSSSPLCVMFSADGEYLMSNSKDTQILFWRTKDGSRHTAMSAYRDMPWQQPWTCVLGWPVIGLWGDQSYDQTDINSVCQTWAPQAGFVALGDDYGKIKLFRFPSPFLDPPCHVYGGHGAHVTRVKFSRTNVLAALGGDDHSISQWSLDFTKRDTNVQPEPLVHPWMDLAEADVPRDKFGFLGRPRAASASAVPRAAGRQQPVHFQDNAGPSRQQQTSSQNFPSRNPGARPQHGPPSAEGRPPVRGRRPMSASGPRYPRGPVAAQQVEAYTNASATPAAALHPREPPARPRRQSTSGGVASALQWD